MRFTRTDDPDVRRPPSSGGRRTRLTLVLVSAVLAVLAGVSAVMSRQAMTQLLTRQDFQVTDALDAKVGTVYGYSLPLWVVGPGTVRVVSARALHTDPGFVPVEPLLGYVCDGGEFLPLETGADLSHRPYLDLRPWGSPLRRAPKDFPCWYVMLRFRADRLGKLAAHDGEITYTTGVHKVTIRFDFEGGVDVDGTGHDKRDTDEPPPPPPPPTPGPPPRPR